MNSPHPSLSRELHVLDSKPSLAHSLQQKRSSVLSLAASNDYIFSGSQNDTISVWCKNTFILKETLKGHTGSVLDLKYVKEKDWLISSSGDSTVRIWSASALVPLYVITPYGDNQAGDLFSISWVPSLETVYIGCQDTSLQWLSFAGYDRTDSPPSSRQTSRERHAGSDERSASHPRKAHKFFDSYPRYQRRPADLLARNGPRPSADDASQSLDDLALDTHKVRSHIPATNVVDSAHYGYIYCMTSFEGHEAGLDNLDGPHLVTGSGDETVKVWALSTSGIRLVHKFSCQHGAVYGFVSTVDTGTIYAACQDGYVSVLDLETRTIVRSVLVEENVALLSLSLHGKDLYTCSADGMLRRWSSSFDCKASWKGHDGIVLSSIITASGGSPRMVLLTGGCDNNINLWDLEPLPSTTLDSSLTLDMTIGLEPETLIFALSKFVSIPSISGDPQHSEDCRQAAIFLKKCLTQLGAKSSVRCGGTGRNPLVVATFDGTVGDKPKRRILFYGHYDVVGTPSKSQWQSDPFTLSGRNGFVYGRGVTDNKGPVLAVACAAADMLRKRKLPVDLVMVIEGEEESGSKGFKESVKCYKDEIGKVDAILVSNSTWITEERPCITYGLRGVVRCSISIKSGLPDLHSGVDGGGIREPMLDLVKLLATLTNDEGHVQIPNFYDEVAPQTEQEEKLYQRLSDLVGRPSEELSSRWREPSLTVHDVQIAGSGNATIIPGSVKAYISLRLVPDQDLDTIVRKLCDFLDSSFKSLLSSNELKVTVEHTADWWLGDLDDRWFKALENAVRSEWGTEPLRIREGGSIPSVPFLEKEFSCPALHLPMGQSSDRAHLPNERISIENLFRGRSVVERFLQNVAETCC